MLNIQYVEEFKDSAAILITGDTRDLSSFGKFLSDWAKNPSKFPLNQLKFHEASRYILIELIPGDRGTSGARIINHNHKILWFIDSERARIFSELVYGVSESKIACHVYLDGDNDEIQIIVSKGEYT